MSLLLLLLPLAAPPETRLEALARKGRESGSAYFAFARRALPERLGVSLPDEARDEPAAVEPFGLLSGAVAIDESLALGKVGRPSWRGERAVPLTKIAGVTIAEHPWKEMMAGKEPRPEPLAECVPHDHWYFTCASPAKLAEIAELLDAWGGSALRLVQVQDRDDRLRERYERQLGVTIAAAAKVPPRLVKGLVLTGSDPYWAEGTDLSVIVETPDPAGLIVALGSPPTAKKLPSHVILSNSPAAVTRILETIAGRRPSLAASLDFRYMRTVFPRGEKEDAFVFLSDAFIRTLVGPATRIKAMRRAAGRAALTLASHAALFRAGEGAEARLPADALEVPDGLPVRWDARRGEAVSDVYGTLREGTPLLDLPVGDLTRGEAEAYTSFRVDYERLWRQYFDPVGVRFRMTPGAIEAEAYILPLINSSAYRGFRRAPGEESRDDPSRLGPTAGAQYRMFVGHHLLKGEGHIALQLDDAAGLGRWLDGLTKWEPSGIAPPVVAVAPGKGAEELIDRLMALGEIMFGMWGVEEVFGRPTARDFAGVKIKRLPILPAGYATLLTKLDRDPSLAGPLGGPALRCFLGPKTPPPVCSAWIAGAYHVAFDEKALERRITAWKGGAKPLGEPAAYGLMVSRKSPHLAAYLEGMLETQVRTKAHAAATLWQELYAAKLVTPAMADAERDGVALRLLGFVPAVPDGSRFAVRGGRVRNLRHGTWAEPSPHDAPDAASPLGKLVRSIQDVTADLRFREDGIHTTVTFRRK